MTTYPLNVTAEWYDVVADGTLRQGDIFRNLLVPYAAPSDTWRDGNATQFDYERGDFILASASCDVDRPDRYPYALLHRVRPVTELKKAGKELDDLLEVMSKGLIPTQYLLAGSPKVTPDLPLSVVLHKHHAMVPTGYLGVAAAVPRLRLRSPHRERFGNWVGSCFSRVGIEDDDLLPSFGKAHPVHVLRANDDA